MTSAIRWVVAIQGEGGQFDLFKLRPIGAALEFTAPDRQAANAKLLASGLTLPDGALLLSRVEFDDLQRSAVKPPYQGARRIRIRGDRTRTARQQGTHRSEGDEAAADEEAA